MVSPRLRRLLGRRDSCEYGCGTCSQGPLVHLDDHARLVPPLGQVPRGTPVLDEHMLFWAKGRQ